jgi:hypothetical protein
VARTHAPGVQRCYTIRSGEGKGTHIPGCWGCAVFGHDRCTCNAGEPATRKSERSIEDRLTAIEAKLEALLKG